MIDPLNLFNLPTPAYMVIWTLTFAYQVEGKKKYSIILFLISIFGNPHLVYKKRILKVFSHIFWGQTQQENIRFQ